MLCLCGGKHFFDGLVERGVAHGEVEVIDAELA